MKKLASGIGIFLISSSLYAALSPTNVATDITNTATSVANSVTNNVTSNITNEWQFRFGMPTCTPTVIEPQNNLNIWSQITQYMQNAFQWQFKFGADDTVNDKILTKIVNQNYNMSLACEDGGKRPVKWYAGIVGVQLVKNEDGKSCKDLEALSDKEYFFFFDSPIIKMGEFPFSYDKAERDVRFRIYYPTKDVGFKFNFQFECENAFKNYANPNVSDGDYENQVNGCIAKVEEDSEDNKAFGTCKSDCDTKLQAHFGAKCDPETQNQDFRCRERWQFRHYLSCVMNCKLASDLDGVNCSDNFAIRPKTIKVVPKNGKFVAGNDVEVTLQALDANNQIIDTFNDFLMLNFEPQEVKSGCATGSIEDSLRKVDFVNGEAKVNIKYSEIGDINLNAVEDDNNLYAAVDKDDEDISLAKISSTAGEIKEFIPAGFDISNISFANFNSGPFTYISEDLPMFSTLTLTIRAKNAIPSNYFVQNFTSACYAKDINVTLNYNNIDTLKSDVVYSTDGVNVSSAPINTPVTYTIPKDKFTTSSYVSQVQLNFKKDYSTPANPTDMVINKIKVYDADAASEVAKSDDSIKSHYLYGRVNIPNVSGYSNVLHSSVIYEYYNDGNWIVNPYHTSSIYGDVKSAVIDNVDFAKENIANGVQAVVYTDKTSVPYSVIGHYSIDRWMWYHPDAKNYSDPSTTNKDCQTHPCNKIYFLGYGSSSSSGQGWAGIGNDNSNYTPDKNRTIDATVKSSGDKAKDQVKKMNW